MRLEDHKLETLRRWGRGLREAGGEEQAAAGRAILMLIEEIERLRLELSRTREQLSREDPASGAAVPSAGESPAATLHSRVQRAARPRTVDERVATSPEAWIESLRRQE
jgi:hypothetical protein